MKQRSIVSMGVCLVACVGAAVYAAACERSTGVQPFAQPESPCPVHPAPNVRFAPVDLTTAVSGDSVLPRVIVDNAADPIDPKLLSTLASNLQLVRWPSGDPVAATLTSENVQPPPPPVERPKGSPLGPDPEPRVSLPLAYITLKPSAPLVPGWYAIRLVVPAGVELAANLAGRGDKSGFLSRFHVGPNPVLASVQVCDKDGGKQAVLFEYSESVVMPQGSGRQGPTISRTDNNPSGCRFPTPATQRAGSHTAVCDTLPVGSGRLHLDATGLVSSQDDKLAIGLPPDAKFTSIAAVDFDLAADMLAVGHHCRILRL